MDDQSERRVDYYRLLRRVAVNRWRLILLVFVGLAIPTTLYALLWVPNTYEAVATIFFEDQEKQRGPSLLREWLPTSDSSPFHLALLSSHSLAQAVIDRLSPQAKAELGAGGMSVDYVGEAGNFIRWVLRRELVFVAPHLRILRELEARMKFEQLKSGEIQIRAAAYQPQVATEVANTYVRVLQARGGSFTREEGRAAREFIESSLKQTKKDLEEAEATLAQFQREKGVVNLPQRSQLDVAKLAQLENALADVQASKEIAGVRLNSLRGGKYVGRRSAPAAAGPFRQQFRERLTELEQKLATLLEKYTEEHPLVVSTLAEIEQARLNLGGTPQVGQRSSSVQMVLKSAEQSLLAKEMADLEVEISALEAKEEVLKQRMAVLTRNLTTANQGELEGLTFVRRVDAKRSLFNLLTERLSQARIQEQAEARGLRVIDHASLPVAPKTMPARIRVLLGLLVGLGLGMGIATLTEYFKQPVETEDDVAEATGLPVLGWLPMVVQNGHGKKEDRRPLSFAQNPTRWSIPLEGCRAIRTAVESLNHERPLRTIMLASAGPKEGKSTVLVNLGWVFWELGRRLVVVDADLRRPTLHRALRLTPSVGITDLLTAKASWEKVRRPIKEDFVLLPGSTTAVANPGALLRTEKVRELLDLLKDCADLVLFDSAPVLAVSDNLLLASLVDGVILVVRADHTQRRDLIRAKQLLERVGARLLGVVINQVRPSEARRYYAQYGSYYSPGDVFSVQRRWWDPRSWWRPKASETYGGNGGMR